MLQVFGFTMSVSLAVHPSLLALAVVALAVGALHNTGSTTSVVPMSVPMPVPMAMTRICNTGARLVNEHHHKEEEHSGGGGNGEDLCGGRHFAVVDFPSLLLLLQMRSLGD